MVVDFGETVEPASIAGILPLNGQPTEEQSPITVSDQTRKILRQELYEIVWKKPLKHVAEELGTTYLDLARICDELDVPRPSHGHWQRLKLGLPIAVFPLPEPMPGAAVEGMLKPKGTPRNTTASPVEHEGETPSESPSALGGHVEPPKSRGSAEKCDASGSPVAGPELPRTVEYTREQLYEAIWSAPCSKLAAQLGVSDVALAKTCRQLGVPRPPRGYWARVDAGEKLPKERLAAALVGQDRVVRFDVAGNVARREEWAINNVLTAGKSSKPGVIELPPEGSELHPIAEKHRRALEKAKPDELGFVITRGKDCIWCDVSLAMAPRLARALHAVINELEDRDYGFETGNNDQEGLQITNDKDRAEIRWSEARVEIEREPTNAEKRKPSWTWKLKETKPSGNLTIEVSAAGLRGKRKWTEEDGRPLGELLGVVVEKVGATFRGYEDLRKREAAWEKQREEEAKRDAERRAKEDEERAKREQERKERERIKGHEAKLAEITEGRRRNLAVAAQQWIKADEIGRFIEYCEKQWRESGGGDLSKPQTEWLDWARSEAVRMAPSANGYPDPAVDGRLDASAVLLGGPYPGLTALK